MIEIHKAVVPQAFLVGPESHWALAEAQETLCRRLDLRQSIAATGAARVEQYDAPRVARLFVAKLERLAKRISAAQSA